MRMGRLATSPLRMDRFELGQKFRLSLDRREGGANGVASDAQEFGRGKAQRGGNPIFALDCRVEVDRKVGVERDRDPSRGELADGLGEDREVETGVAQLQAEGLRPVDAGTDGLGGLAIREVLSKLQHGHQRKSPGCFSQAAAGSEHLGETRVIKDRTEFIAHADGQTALGDGSAGNSGGFSGHGTNRVRAYGHRISQEKTSASHR